MGGNHWYIHWSYLLHDTRLNRLARLTSYFINSVLLRLPLQLDWLYYILYPAMECIIGDTGDVQKGKKVNHAC